jgi:peptide/nickel transport system substrate-binding protein
MGRERSVRTTWSVLFLVVIAVITFGTLLMPEITTAQARKPTGTVVIAVGTFGNEVFFPNQASVPELSLMSSLWDSLVNMKPGARDLIPGLAERWTHSNDGKTYTFFLRKGVPFHDDWGEFTAEDAKFSIELIMKPESKALRAGYFRQNVESIRVVNPYQLVIQLKSPNVELPYVLANHRNEVPMLCKKHVEKVGDKEAAKHPVGTGPYKFLEWRVGEYIKMEALDNHWRQVASFKNLVLRAVPEEASRVAMLRAGEADIAEISLAFKEEVEKGGLKILRSPGSAYCQIWLCGQVLPTRPNYDPKLPWVGDYKDPASQERAKKVRMALNWAIDRNAIIDSIFKGEAEITAVQGSFDRRYYPSDMKPYSYDPAGAKRLLAEAGYPNGFEMTLMLATMPGRLDGPLYGEAVAQMWEKNLGLKVRRKVADYAAELRPLLSARNANWAWTGDVIRFDEPFMLLTSGHLTTNPLLYGGIESPEIDALVDSAAREFDPEKRFKINQAIGKWYYDHSSAVPICSKSGLWGLGKKVADWSLVPGNPYPHFYEYVVPAR